MFNLFCVYTVITISVKLQRMTEKYSANAFGD